MKVALVGNPNSGKTSLFNALTGLNQKVGNFPGVTVEKKIGKIIVDNHPIELIDLPGTYSLYPKSYDEEITFQVLCDPNSSDRPDAIIVVADATNLKRNLLFITQIIDLGLPVILALNMIDLVAKQRIEIDIETLSSLLGIVVCPTNARNKGGLGELEKQLLKIKPSKNPAFYLPVGLPLATLSLFDNQNTISEYQKYVLILNYEKLENISLKTEIKESLADTDLVKIQGIETVNRFQKIAGIMRKCFKKEHNQNTNSTTKAIDAILTHSFWGYLIFLGIMFLVFQSIFSWATFPMEMIEMIFNETGKIVASVLPKGMFADLLVNGILAGLGGVIVFLPQILLLTGFISLLEETGYMSRVSFLTDKLMRKIGLNGKSIVPLLSGYACAVPAILSARTIGSWKERIITILITPLMSCSARLPVYTLLIALFIKDDKVIGIFSLQGLILMAFYLLGFVMAIMMAFIVKPFIKEQSKSYFILEMPIYRAPRWKNIFITLIEKGKNFVFETGKIIIAISIILWFLSSYGPSDNFAKIDKKYTSKEYVLMPEKDKANNIAKEKLEKSYAGILGKTIEPAIRPLGFDWKIGISLITSFAAREVFVGTMATIYSLGPDDFDLTKLKEKMSTDINPATGRLVFTTATALSLMVFYAFAMQCMSTLAVTRRETGNWKWPFIQFSYMTILAYLGSLATYQILNAI